MRWVQLAFGISLVATLILHVRARKERRETRTWKGYRSDPPMDLSGLEPLNPANYTPAGQRPYNWFIAGYVVTLSLGIVLILMSRGR